MLVFYRMQLVDIIIFFVIILIVGVVLMSVSALFLKAPYVPTPIAVCKEMISLADLQGNETIYDLGAGDARLLSLAKDRYPNVTAKGSELAFPVFLWGKIKLILSGKKVEFHLKNLFAENLRDADCIFLYLMPGIMEKLIAKFDAELTPGTKIVSYAFSLHGKDPVEKKEVPWIQGKKYIYLYRW